MKHNYFFGKIILPALLATLIPLSAFAQDNNAPAPMKFSENEVVVVSAQAAPAAPAAAPASSGLSPYVKGSWNAKNGSVETDKMWNLKLYGYIRTGFHWNSVEYTAADQLNSAQNDYFYVAHARLGVQGDFFNKMFGFNILVDGGGLYKQSPKEPSTSLKDKSRNTTHYGSLAASVNLMDAYVTYTPFSFVTLQVGQFIPNFNYEGMASTAARPFANLSVANALSVGRRELGVSLGATKFQPFSEGTLAPLGFTYSLALTNGENAAAGLPLGSVFGFYSYFGANWGKLVSLNFGYYAQPSYTYQAAKDFDSKKPEFVVRSKTLTQGVSTDLTLSAAGLNFTLGYIRKMGKTTEYDQDGEVDGDPTEDPAAQGMLAFLQYTYEPLGLTPGIRYAFQNPNVDLEGDKSETKHEITLGLNWKMASFPIKAVANYGIHLQKGASLSEPGEIVMKPTHHIDLVLQAQW